MGKNFPPFPGQGVMAGLPGFVRKVSMHLVAIIVEAPGCTKLQTSICNTHRLLQNKKHLNIVSVVIKAFLLLDNV